MNASTWPRARIAEATTDARVLRAVVRLCGEVFQQPVISIGVPGENPIPTGYGKLVQQLSGDFEFRIVRLGHEPSRPLPSLIALSRTTWELPESVALADVVILVPALWQDPAGAVHGALDAVAALGPELVSNDSMRVDLVSAVGPLYVFADVLRPRVGPATRPLNFVLASDDPCAVDAVGARPGAGGRARAGQGRVGRHQCERGADSPTVPKQVTLLQRGLTRSRPG